MKYQRQVSDESFSKMNKKSSRRRRGSEEQFPGKLHRMMEHVEKESLDNIISWVCDGRAIMIHDPNELVKVLLPNFFCQTKFRSFERQLNMWHFERLVKGPHRGAFVHPLFLKDKAYLCKHMSRNLCDNPWKQTLSMDYLLHEMDAAAVINAALKNRNLLIKQSSLTEPSWTSCPHKINHFKEEENDLIIWTIGEAESALSTGTATNNNCNNLASCQAVNKTNLLNVEPFELSLRSTSSSSCQSLVNSTLIGDDDEELNEIFDLKNGDVSSFAGRQFYVLDEPNDGEMLADTSTLPLPMEGMPTNYQPQAMALHKTIEAMYIDVAQRTTRLFDLVRSVSGEAITNQNHNCSLA